MKINNNLTIVYLKCRGHWELIHELLHPDWLGNVKIEKPEILRQEFKAYLSKCEAAIN